MSYIPGKRTRRLSTLNASAIPLADGDSFTGALESTDGYASIYFWAQCDVHVFVQVQYTNDDGATFIPGEVFQTTSGSPDTEIFSQIRGSKFQVVVNNDSGADATTMQIGALLLPDPQNVSGAEVGFLGEPAPEAGALAAMQLPDGSMAALAGDAAQRLRVFDESGQLLGTVIDNAVPARVMAAEDDTGTPTLQKLRAHAGALFVQVQNLSGLALDASLVTLLAKLEAVRALLAGTLSVSGVVAVAGSVTVSASALPTGAATESTLSTISGKMPTLSGGKVPVTDPTALPLPTGAATETTLAAASAKLPAALVGGKLSVTDPGALPLPAGAATETTLAAASAKLPAALVGGKLSVTDPGALPLPAGASTEATLATLSGNTPAPVQGGRPAVSSGTGNTAAKSWTSATALNDALLILNGDRSVNSISIALAMGTPISGGAVTFEKSQDGTVWSPCLPVNPPTEYITPTVTGTPGTGCQNGTFTFAASANSVLRFDIDGNPFFRARLSTVITGAGTVTVGFQTQSLANVPGSAHTIQKWNLSLANGLAVAAAGTLVTPWFDSNADGVTAAIVNVISSVAGINSGGIAVQGCDIIGGQTFALAANGSGQTMVNDYIVAAITTRYWRVSFTAVGTQSYSIGIAAFVGSGVSLVRTVSNSTPLVGVMGATQLSDGNIAQQSAGAASSQAVPGALICGSNGLAMNSGGLQIIRVPQIFQSAKFTASGVAVIWQPNSAKKFRLMRYRVEVPINAAISGGAATLKVYFQDGTQGVVTLTAWSITANVVTFTGANALVAGQKFRVAGLVTGSFMNGAMLSVVTPTGTTFTANFTHANASASEAGTATPAPSLEHDIFIPATAATTGVVGYNSGWIDLGNGHISIAANNPLNVGLDNTLTTGAVRVAVCGTEE